MAKAKSKKITIEEALVPVEEQEYNIPNNWIWIYQNFVCQLANGEKMSGEEYPYLEVKYLRGDTDAEIKDSGRFITANTKVILVDGENSGEVFEVLEDGYMGSTFKAPMMQQVRDKAVQVVDNIDTIKKSILAKAFRGELGTNISEDESAMELLKIILNKGEC